MRGKTAKFAELVTARFADRHDSRCGERRAVYRMTLRGILAVLGVGCAKNWCAKPVQNIGVAGGCGALHVLFCEITNYSVLAADTNHPECAKT